MYRDNIIKKIIYFYNIRKWSIRQISKKFGLDRKAIKKTLENKEFKIIPVPQYKNIITKKALKIMNHKRKLTLTQIANYYKCARSTIHSYMRKFNLKTYTKLTKRDLIKIATGELWLSAKECLEKGIVDKIIK